MGYHRILVITRSKTGSFSQSEMIADALVSNGQGVTWLSQEVPYEADGATVRPGYLSPHLEHWRPEALLLFDGVSLDETMLRCAEKAGTAVCSVDSDGVARLLAHDGETHGAAAPLCTFQPSVSRGYAGSELALFVEDAPVVACFGDATEERRTFLETVLSLLRGWDVPAKAACFGAGWEAPFLPIDASSRLAYASRFSIGAVVFDGERIPADCAVLAFDGTRVFVTADAGEAPGWIDPQAVSFCTDATTVASALRDAHESREGGTEWTPAPRRASLLATPLLDDQAREFVDVLEQRGVVGPGKPAKARYVCLCGYYGTGNFGDEMILSHIAHDLDERHGLVVTTAVAAIPAGVWEQHGIPALEPSDHAALARVLERSSALVITAGLLFDQGMRWTCGKGALASGARYTDLPGLALVTLLARAHDVPVLFFGTGDGPLELEASRTCVKMAGDLGARFYARNQASFDLLASCGLPQGGVVLSSDTLYGLKDPGADAACAWGDAHGLDFRDGKVVVVALREWPGLPDGYEAAFARGLDALAAAGCDVLFVDFSPEDTGIHDRVAALMTAKERAHRYGVVRDLSEIVSVLSAAWAGFCLRLHCALILARFGHPSVGVGYLPKVEALFEQTGQTDLLVPLDFDEPTLLEACDALAKRCGEYSRIVQEKSHEQFGLLKTAVDALDDAVSRERPKAERRIWHCDHSLAEFDRMELARLADEQARTAAELARAREALDAANRENERLRREIDDLRSSHSYKLGHAVMKPLSRIAGRTRKQD